MVDVLQPVLFVFMLLFSTKSMTVKPYLQSMKVVYVHALSQNGQWMKSGTEFRLQIREKKRRRRSKYGILVMGFESADRYMYNLA